MPVKAVVARLILGIFKMFQINSQARDGTQAPELSVAPQEISMCRRVWEPPGSGDEPPAPRQMHTEHKDRERPEGVSSGGFPRHREGSGLSKFVI